MPSKPKLEMLSGVIGWTQSPAEHRQVSSKLLLRHLSKKLYYLLLSR